LIGEKVSCTYYYNGKVVGQFVADIIVDIGLLLNFGENKMGVKQKCGYYLLYEMVML